jgi:hypothetical protein
MAKVCHNQLNELSLLQGNWDKLGQALCDGSGSAFSAYMSPDLSDEPGSYTVTDVQMHVLTAKANKNDADSPSFAQAINSTNAEKWWRAMELEIFTLESKLNA